MTADVSADILVVIPGILGSRLTRREDTIWGVGHSALNLWRLARKLTGDLRFVDNAYDGERETDGIDDGVVTAGLLQTRAIIPGLWHVDGYSDLIARLTAGFPNQQVITFPYDWRQSNRVTARRLAARVVPAITEHRRTANFN
jgi:hypothetical protein